MTNYIEHIVTTEEPFNGNIERNETIFWAVRPPRERWWTQKPGEGDFTEGTVIGGGASFIISGGQPVYIYDQTDIDGLRGLLEKIEAVLAADGANA